MYLKSVEYEARSGYYTFRYCDNIFGDRDFVHKVSRKILQEIAQIETKECIEQPTQPKQPEIDLPERKIINAIDDLEV